jgi:hypothetical protein
VVSGLVRGSEAWETALLLVSETVTSSLDQSGPDSGSGTLEVGYGPDLQVERLDGHDSSVAARDLSLPGRRGPGGRR